MKKLASFMVTFFLVAFIAGCGNAEVGKSSGTRVADAQAADFQLKDIKGNTFKLSDYSGKLIVLNFFATWCPPCRREMPDFNEIAKEYSDDVEVIAVNIGRESLPKVISFVNNHKLEFTVAMDDGRVSSLYGPINAIPVTVIINKDFKIAKRYIGMRSKEFFAKEIEKLL